MHACYDLSTTGLDYEATLANGSSVSIVGKEPDRLALLPSLGAELSAGNFALKALLSGTVSDRVSSKNSIKVLLVLKVKEVAIQLASWM